MSPTSVSRFVQMQENYCVNDFSSLQQDKVLILDVIFK